MSRIRQGWELTKKSWALLRSNKQLFRFPVYAALSALAVTVIAVLPGIYLIDDGSEALGGVITAIGLYLTAFVGIYFAVGLAATADRLFRGEAATVRDGMAVANSRLGAIAGWAALSALVGLITSLLEQAGEFGAAIAAALIGTAWSLVTFMAVPVIAIEGTGPWATLKRSGALFKERWVGQVTGNVAVGGIVFLLGVLPAVVLIALGVMLWASDGGGADIAGGAVLVVIGVALFAISMLIVQAMRSVFGIALYRFASSGEVITGFTQADLESAVRTK